MEELMRTMTLLMCFLLVSAGKASAEKLTVGEQCGIAKLTAARQLAQCITSMQIVTILKEDRSGPDAAKQALGEVCKKRFTEKFEKAEARARANGGQCPTEGDAFELQTSLGEIINGCAWCGCC